MNRSEFLNRLREALENDLGGSAVQEHILYYDEYIRNEIRNGKTEREVLDMLGDPWIIAKTIIAAGGNAATQENSSWSYDTGDEEKRNNKSRGNMIAHILGIDTWWKKILFFLGVILVILVIFAVITGIVRLLLPIVIPLLLILVFFRIFGRRN